MIESFSPIFTKGRQANIFLIQEAESARPSNGRRRGVPPQGPSRQHRCRQAGAEANTDAGAGVEAVAEAAEANATADAGVGASGAVDLAVRSNQHFDSWADEMDAEDPLP